MLLAREIDFLLAGLEGNNLSANYNGKPLAGGTVKFYNTGTTTLATIWRDSGKALISANPVTLGVDGTASVFGDGTYDVVVYDADGNAISTLNGLNYSLPSLSGLTVLNVSANTTLSAAGYLVICDTSGGAFNVTLSSASGAGGKSNVIVNIGAYPLTVLTTSPDQINGGTAVLVEQYQAAMPNSNGVNWFDTLDKKSGRVQFLSSTTDTTLKQGNWFVRCTPAANGMTINLPSAVGMEQRMIYIQNAAPFTSGAMNSVIIMPVSGQGIGGMPVTAVEGGGDTIALMANNGNWDVIGVGQAAPTIPLNLFDDPEFVFWAQGSPRNALANGAFINTLFAYGKSASVTAVHNGYKANALPLLTDLALEVSVATAQVSLGANDVVNIGTVWTGYKLRQIWARAASFGFWVKATVPGTYCFFLQNVGTAGTPDRSYVSEYTITASGVWQFIPIPPTDFISIVGDPGTWNFNSQRGLAIGWCLGAGANYQTAAANLNKWVHGAYMATPNQVNSMASINNTFSLALLQANPGARLYKFYRPELFEQAGRVGLMYEKSYDEYVPPGTNTEVGVVYGTAVSGSRITGFQFKNYKRTFPTMTVYSKLGVAGKVTRISTGLDEGSAALANIGVGLGGVAAIEDAGAPYTAGAGYAYHYVAEARL